MSTKPYIVFFAGSVAAGKTDAAYYLSEQFNLPIFSSDAVRRDAKVEKNVVDIHDALNLFEANRSSRLKAMLAKKQSFIIDASVDRRWAEYKKLAEENGFAYILISFDLSRKKIMDNKARFDHVESKQQFEKWIDDHQKFFDQHAGDAQLHITDENYTQRQELMSKLVKEA